MMTSSALLSRAPGTPEHMPCKHGQSDQGGVVGHEREEGYDVDGDGVGDRVFTL